MGTKFVLQVEKVLDWLHNSANTLALLNGIRKCTGWQIVIFYI